MIKRKKINKDLHMPLDKEEYFVKKLNDNVNEILEALLELEGDEETKEFIANEIGEIEDLFRVFVYKKGIPKHLDYPWNVEEMS